MHRKSDICKNMQHNVIAYLNINYNIYIPTYNISLIWMFKNMINDVYNIFVYQYSVKYCFIL